MSLQERLANSGDVLTRAAFAEVFEHLIDIPDVEETLLGGIVSWEPNEAMAAARCFTALHQDTQQAVTAIAKLQQLLEGVRALEHLQICTEQVGTAVVHGFALLGGTAGYALEEIVLDVTLPDVVRGQAAFWLASRSYPKGEWITDVELLAAGSLDGRARMAAELALHDLRS